MKKTENDELLVAAFPVETVQITLPLAGDTQEAYWTKWRSQEQESAFQKLLEGICAERQSAEAIARALFPDSRFEKLWELPPDQYTAVWAEHRKQNPRPVPIELSLEPEQRKYKPFKPLVPWSRDRKQKERLRRMVQRFRQALKVDSSQLELITELSPLTLWIDAVQQALCKNPGHFGVCSLPNSGVDRSPLALPDLEQERAIARENELRMQEAGMSLVHSCCTRAARFDRHSCTARGEEMS